MKHIANLGVDIGGTFTDVVLEIGETLFSAKVLTTYAAPEAAILDGLATEKGDSSRGSRYNSAVRYVESSRYACLAIVVSEDGLIDLLPPLKR